MVIVETSVFTRRIQQFLVDDEHRELQSLLVARPHLGKVIQGGGGLRKTRYSYNNLGKSKALRLIYYYAETRQQLLMLYVYPKSETADLTKSQVAALRKLIEATYP
ncbi:hypothetical protein EHF33_00435 [Deinococcus psychrotolerans]|uniref:Toxin RelE n=1 Tax=Deinococcus psychrotolerans TaxID=2489213 RepID=A0A3G8YK30_9DEIO|nr:type II toxin-antitoxin system RelE/ParE family toxin [Deinococcus psychrotolerans]AZI41406.1 hypothetical protein EHF33_00435 [Deinococcus psychrotolerans]